MLRMENWALLQSLGCVLACVALQMCQIAIAEIFKNAKRGLFIFIFFFQAEDGIRDKGM